METGPQYIIFTSAELMFCAIECGSHPFGTWQFSMSHHTDVLAPTYCASAIDDVIPLTSPTILCVRLYYSINQPLARFCNSLYLSLSLIFLFVVELNGDSSLLASVYLPLCLSVLEPLKLLRLINLVCHPR